MIDYLTTPPCVDRDRIKGTGIRAGGGYTASAAIDEAVSVLAPFFKSKL